ncbi:unnamed protein product [Adineta ricciae]|uniref:Uncharacterized protein n=1 Tax=Adineta ricciae TaxID=249248 RepID=A0A815UI14_ADIRI|nr:unnamed protein product [Adineta ricciae]CAF1516212.1 unnamed protein product [Adineta ricciae]
MEWLKRLVSRLRALNFFASPLTVNNEYEVQNERIATRIFVVLLILVILVLVVYTGQVNVTHTIEIKHPLYQQFQSLAVSYPDTLRCPCTNVAVQQSTFIILEPQFHQLCTSGFVTSEWIEHISSNADLYAADDFSRTGGLFFQTLASFCRLANSTIASALETFSLTNFITIQALTEPVFNEQINAIIHNFRSTTELTFYQSFDLVTFTTLTNTLLSGLMTNALFQLYRVVGQSYISISSYSRKYVNNTCRCGLTATCTAPSRVEDRRYNTTTATFTIPGLVTGCYLVEATRRSTLECFYSTTCMTAIEQYLQASVALTYPVFPLNASIESQFNMTSNIDQILAFAMTEQWIQNISHSQYFAQCFPTMCSYTYKSRFDVIYVITTLIALIGGVVKVLRLLLLRIVKIVRRRIRALRQSPNLEGVGEGLIHRSVLERLRAMNFFVKQDSTELQIQQQLTSTRIFFVLLVVSFIILMSYYVSQQTTRTFQVESPTYEQFMQLQNNQLFNSSLSCPCSTLTTAYANLIHVSYVLHPLCTSTFVNSSWISSITHHNNYIAIDFRSIAAKYFNGLYSYCQFALKYIQHSLVSFNSTSFIADRALTPISFEAKAEAIVETFISSTTRSFSHNLALMSNTTQSNRLVSNDQTNSGFSTIGTYPFYPIEIYPIYLYTSSGKCQCLSTVQCTRSMSIYLNNASGDDSIPLFDVPGLSQDCLLNDGIRHSTFVCLFNQSCVNFLTFWLVTTNVTAIDEHKLVHFDIDSTVDDMIHALFVDQWNHSISHDAFYENCRPERCTYTLVEHNSFWLICTTIFGLIGGLIKVLQIVIPPLVEGVHTLKIRYHQRNEPRSTSVSTTGSIRSALKQLRQLNLFSSQGPDTPGKRDVKDQIISTRLFIILLAVSLITLTVYSSQVEVAKTVTVSNPSIEQYYSLYASHADTLTCPCQNISIPQGLFLLAQPSFHQICQSDFINPIWFNAFVFTKKTAALLGKDFRVRASAMFNTLASLCQLSIEAIENGLLDFGIVPFVSTQLLSSNEVLRRGHVLISLFISTTENSFATSLQTIRDTTQANGLMSGLKSSMILNAMDQGNEYLLVNPLYETYNNGACSCDTDAACAEPAAIYGGLLPSSIYTVQGFMVGCYVVDAILQSNLQLLYTQSSIDDLQTRAQYNNYTSFLMNATALKTSLFSQYNITTPVSVMSQKLMTEQWFSEVNYPAYYKTCHPIECKYTYTEKYDIFYIITTIISLIGGLTMILQIVVPRLVAMIRKYSIKLCHHRVGIDVQTQ